MYFSKVKLYDSIFYLLSMWFWLINETIDFISGMPAPQFGDEYSWVRGSQLVQGSRFKVQAVSVFRFDLCKMFSRTP
jgi:hypothetical protein